MDILDQFKGELERNGKNENTIVAYLSDLQKSGQWLFSPDKAFASY